MGHLRVLLITIRTHQDVERIRPKETFLNGGNRKPELLQLVGFVVSLQLILELAYIKVQLRRRVGIHNSGTFGVDIRLVRGFKFRSQRRFIRNRNRVGSDGIGWTRGWRWSWGWQRSRRRF